MTSYFEDTNDGSKSNNPPQQIPQPLDCMTENPPMLAAIRGCLIGTAVGDALGLPAEGLSQQRAASWWKGDWRMRLLPGRGMVSDDTEHTYAVAEALSVAHGDVERFRRILAGKLRWWFLALPAGVGMATARACIKLWLGFSPANSGVFSAGNGPAMRSALIGVFFRDDPVRRREFVVASARITHTDSLAETVALAVAKAAACGANGGDRDAFVSSLAGMGDSDKWRCAVSRIAVHLESGSSTREFACAMGLERGVSGYALHTVPVALYAWLRYHDDFAQALTSALDCGGDTDTVGAIVGALAGASLGCDSIPDEWRNQVRDWPLSASRLDSAAIALCESETVPAIFWPFRCLRNVVFLFIILAHGFRRLLPPY